MNIQEFEYKAETAVALLKQLAGKPRLMLLCHLAKGEKSVGQLGHLVGLRSSAVSQHLALMRAEGLVGARRAGTTVYYRLTNEVVRELIAVLYRHHCEREGPPVAASH